MSKLQLIVLIIRAIRSHYYYQCFFKYWFEIILGILCVHLILVKDVKVSIHFKEKGTISQVEAPVPVVKRENIANKLFRKENASSENSKNTVPKAQSFYNLTFILSPDYAQRKGIPSSIIEEKKQLLQAYLEIFSSIAQTEQEQYNIPASITLAQGLLESNAGDSRLAKESFNHFGIKCRSKCKGCTCRNYHDDDYYDMFRVFESPWESYREHSILLNTKRYQHLKVFGKDYKKWAKGLQDAGYATDKKYAEKLVKIIQALQLNKYDE